MANQEHLDILKQGVDVWNKWREANSIIPELHFANLKETNLIGANLNGADLRSADLKDTLLDFAYLKGADLSKANLRKAVIREAHLNEANLSEAILYDSDLHLADFSKADLKDADLSKADLRGANLSEANFFLADLSFTNLSEANLANANLSTTLLKEANFRHAHLRNADLSKALLQGANFKNANLRGANLQNAILKEANLTGADLEAANLTGADLSGANLSEANLRSSVLIGCNVYATSAWNIELEKAIQSGLIITKDREPTITVDNLEVAQFIYLLLNNKKIRDVIDTITSKVVLILGRFTNERKKVLDAIRVELIKHNYSPILFDFEKPISRDFTETIRTLAHLARFIIADLTDPSSIPQELQAIVPDLEVPIQPLLLDTKREYAMFVDFRKYHWVLPIYLYKDLPSLLVYLNGNIIDAAEKKVRELALEKGKRLDRP